MRHRNTDGYDFEILSMFYQLLHILVKKYRKLDVQDELLKSNQQLNRLGMITSYLKDHYMEDISLGKLAVISFSSPSAARVKSIGVFVPFGKITTHLNPPSAALHGA